MIKLIKLNFLYVASAALIMIAPLILYLLDTDHRLFTLETVTLYFVLTAIGIVAGLVMSSKNKLVRVASGSTLLMYSVVTSFPSQFPKFSIFGVEFNEGTVFVMILLLLIILSSLAFHKLDRILLVVFGTLLGSSILLNIIDHWSVTTKKPIEVKYDGDLPPLLHIVLDGHIGIEGVQPKFQTGIMNKIKEDYLSLGFNVFGRAYSLYGATKYSLPSFMNLVPMDNFNEFVVFGETGDRYLLKNRIFQQLSADAYQIKVLQSSYYDLCRGVIAVSDCVTYETNSFDNLDGLTYWDNLTLLTSVILRRARFFNAFNYARNFLKLRGVSSNLPLFSLHAPYLPSLIAYSKINDVEQSLQVENSMGIAYFMHLLIPHSPYLLDESCHIYKDQIMPLDTKLHKDLGFDEKYYFNMKQVTCLHNRLFPIIKGFLKKYPSATVMIHGDHGSRIVKQKPIFSDESTHSAENYMGRYSTLFLAKASQTRGEYLREPVPINDAISMTLNQNFKHTDKHEVYIGDKPSDVGEEKNYLHSLPPFSYGEAATSWE